MKDYLKILLVVIVSLFTGAWLRECQGPNRQAESTGGCVVDTITYVDTVTYLKPEAAQTHNLGLRTVTLPTYYFFPSRQENKDSVMKIRADTVYVAKDSVSVNLPIEQKVYSSDDYKAYVSGTFPRLDSIFVYPKREVVTIKKPPKRWHIGPTIGYGYTPHGFEPYVGVSLTYSLFSF